MISNELRTLIERKFDENADGATLYIEFNKDGAAESLCDGNGVYIIGAFERLVAEFADVTGVSFEDLIEEIKTCHKVGDELYITGKIH